MALQLDLDKDRYVSLLEKLIGEVQFLQDNPPKFVPQEDRCALITSPPVCIGLVFRLCLLSQCSLAGYMQCKSLPCYNGYIHVA